MCIYVNIYVYKWIYVSTCVYMYICVRVYMYIFMYMSVFVYKCVHIHIKYMCVYYVYTCNIYKHMYTHREKYMYVYA